MDAAARTGHFELLKWLHEYRTEGCSSNAIECAAANGHFEIVKWLHANYGASRGSSHHGIDFAAEKGHLEIVKWLHEATKGADTSCCTQKAMDAAVRYGHLEVVQWLHANRTEGCSTDAMKDAAGN